MMKKSTIPWFLLLLWASGVRGQSEALCPANGSMGLCVEVPQPCLSDTDCYNGDICCPEACSRTCKPRNVNSVQGDGSIPDLLHDPRVYIGNCPDSSCFSLFSDGSDECSTSKLCSQEQTCCNDGCRNVCQWKPEFAALIAQEQARVRQRQQLIIHRQQEETKRKQREMYLQHQRQAAAAEHARKQQEARAAAEAELAAQQTRAKYEADLKAMAEAKTKSVQSLQQAMAQQNNQNQQGQEAPLPQITPSPRSSDNIARESPPVFSINSESGNLAQLQPHFSPPPDASTLGQVSSNKKNNFAGSLINQINSPANVNPYSLLSQNAYNKAGQGDIMSLFQAAASTSAVNTMRNNVTANLRRSNLAQNIYSAFSDLKSSPVFSPQNVNQVQTRPTSNIYSAQQRPTSYVQNLPGSQSIPTYPVQNQPPPYTARRALSIYPMNVYNRHPASSFLYRPSRQYTASLPYRQQRRHDSMAPFLMYQAMQSAA